MESPPRRHHYVPAFYLAQFSLEGNRDSRLFVFDQNRLKSWSSTPDGSAHQRDFYAVDLGPDKHPATFEAKVMSEVDGKCSAVVKKVISDMRVPSDEDLGTLLNFVATSMARTPRIRRLVDQVFAHVANEYMKSLVSTDEGWEMFLALSPEARDEFSEAELRKHRQAIIDDSFDIKVDNTSDKLNYNTWQVQNFLEFVGRALALLAERNWVLGVGADGAPDFVCSDTPVSLAIDEDFSDSDTVHLANKRTTVLMPLSRRAALIGSYKIWPPTFTMSESGVLQLNSLTIIESTHVFSATSEFSYLGSNGQTMGKEDLVRASEGGTYKHDNLEDLLNKSLKYPTFHQGDAK